MKWHSDRWQQKIHGRSLVYFGERALVGLGPPLAMVGPSCGSPSWLVVDSDPSRAQLRTGRMTQQVYLGRPLTNTGCGV